MEDAVEDYHVQWNTAGTKLLIELYQKYRPQVGTASIKSIKQMWIIIGGEVSECYNKRITPSNCENRWRVLERNYKKYKESLAGKHKFRKFFEFSEDMEKIYNEKNHDIVDVPDLVTIRHITNYTVNQDSVVDEQEHQEEQLEEVQVEPEPERPAKRMKHMKGDILESIRLDRLKYQRRRLDMESKKLELLKERNKLIEERNKILEEHVCCCSKKVTN